ncbi:MAG TPA: MlaD family protein [Candidatus Omnitrophota bacterium]|nr:MlaD family protein [Candidatus Omnitrophota bacterium]HRY85814.1 MlaD family protein [Candidatus Omnitrophota bacterium]
MKKKNDEVSVGVFVILGFIFLTLVLFFVSGVYLFRSGYTVDVIYDYVSILNKGAPVRMAGVRVGEVSKVDLFYDGAKQQNRVKVKLFIEKGAEIRENYEFTIRGTHILSEPHVEITPRPGAFPLLRKGSVVEGVPLVAVEEMMDKAHEALDNISSLSGSLNDSLKKPDGDINQSFKNIESLSASLATVAAKVEKGEGTLGRLVMEDDLYQEMDAFAKDVRAHPWKLVRKDSKSKRKWYFLWLV